MAALKAAAMCNDAGFGPDGKLLGDPMETALLHAVRAVGLDIEELKSQEPDEEPTPSKSGFTRMRVRPWPNSRRSVRHISCPPKDGPPPLDNERTAHALRRGAFFQVPDPKLNTRHGNCRRPPAEVGQPRQNFRFLN